MSMDISDVLLNLTKSFLTNRFQRIALNSQTSEDLPLKADVEQGPILSPLSFVTYINDLSVDIMTYPLWNYLWTIHYYFPLSIILMLQQMNLQRFAKDIWMVISVENIIQLEPKQAISESYIFQENNKIFLPSNEL